MPNNIVAVPAQFIPIYNRLEKREGGFSNRKDDRGGATNHGITISTLSRWRGSPVTAQDVMDLKREEAILIAYNWYWLVENYDAFLDNLLAEFMFDWGYNSGPDLAVRKLQDFIGAKPDGSIGPETLHKLFEEKSKHGSSKFYQHLCDYRLRFFGRICQKDKTQTANLIGWMNRISSLRYLAD